MAFIPAWLASILEATEPICFHPFLHGIQEFLHLFHFFVVWQYTDQDQMQFPMRSHFWHLECYDSGVTIDGVWVGYWIYLKLEYTTQNYTL
jgi:hypothetical protein